MLPRFNAAHSPKNSPYTLYYPFAIIQILTNMYILFVAAVLYVNLCYTPTAFSYNVCNYRYKAYLFARTVETSGNLNVTDTSRFQSQFHKSVQDQRSGNPFDQYRKIVQQQRKANPQFV